MNTKINNKIRKFIRRIAAVAVAVVCVSSYSSAFAATPDTTVMPDVTAEPASKQPNKRRVDDFEVKFNHALEEATILNYYGESNDMVIPNEIEGYKVVRLNCDKVSIDVRKRVTSIHFPENLKYIYTYYSLEGKTRARLFGYDNLSKITVDEANETFKVVDGMLVNKKSKALYLCPQKLEVKKVVIPKEVEKIYNGAFENDYIEIVIIGKHVKKVGAYAFSDSNIKKVVWKAKCNVIDEITFSNCKKLETVRLKSKIKRIYAGAFECCGKLKKIKLPKSVKYIGIESFTNCKQLKKVVVPKKAKVEKTAFPKGCKIIRK